MLTAAAAVAAAAASADFAFGSAAILARGKRWLVLAGCSDEATTSACFSIVLLRCCCQAGAFMQIPLPHVADPDPLLLLLLPRISASATCLQSMVAHNLVSAMLLPLFLCLLPHTSDPVAYLVNSVTSHC